MSEPVKNLVLKKISFRYNDRKNFIIKDFSMEIPNPSITTLLGLNGSGKTTLLMLLLGYYKPTNGEIFLESSSERREIDQINGLVGYLPQRENLPFDYSVMDFILLGRNSHLGIFAAPGPDDIQKMHDAMKFLEIEDLGDRNLSSISGGELQRVRIARLLVQDPKIILLDEPSSHLDIKSKKQIIELIDRFRELGKIIIYSTHEPIDALNFSDYSILMKKKHEMLAGESQKIITSESLSHYFDTTMDINEVKGQRIVIVENGNKAKIPA